MDNDIQPRSILKKSNSKKSTIKENSNQKLAEYHAGIIQRRKEFESQILQSIETLMEYPLAHSPFDASCPSPVDIANFKRLAQIFRPNDYDDLILERNINEHCGYTLCPNKRHRENCTGKYRLMGTGGKAKDFKVVEVDQLEKWCSLQCAKRALYVRIQLSEVPVWERKEKAEGTVTIDLLDEPRNISSSILERIIDLKIDLEDSRCKAIEPERRTVKKDSTKSSVAELSEIQVHEVNVDGKNETIPTIPNPSYEAHLKLEGHVSKFRPSAKGPVMYKHGFEVN
ncbi:unnamed protein product [Blumeria hordei]|uniref:RNA polymerase II subunit B1 CTD phosphatase RPAP2 homolog n=1 Tax=Blumeria hordei TaxID=2867405 RepID=A0A383UGW3_BLUHO|nr:unnamed protein product [Blumeria hordei]